MLSRNRSRSRYCDENINLEVNQFGRQAPKTLRLFRREAVFQHDGPAIDITNIF